MLTETKKKLSFYENWSYNVTILVCQNEKIALGQSEECDDKRHVESHAGEQTNIWSTESLSLMQGLSC